MPNLSKDLEEELAGKMSLTRLAKAGLFKKLPTDGHEEIRKELILHRCVLDKALIDMFSSNKKLKKEIEDWLDLDNPDFIECCELAYLTPEKVYSTFQAMKRILRGKNAEFNKFKRTP